MLNYMADFFPIILNVVLSKIYNSKRVWVFQMGCFNKIEYLYPVSVLERFFLQILQKLYN